MSEEPPARSPKAAAPSPGPNRQICHHKGRECFIISQSQHRQTPTFSFLHKLHEGLDFSKTLSGLVKMKAKKKNPLMK